MKRKFFIFSSIIIFMCSCYDHESHQVLMIIGVNNQTQHNVHVLYNQKDISMSDSTFYFTKLQKDSSGLGNSNIGVGFDTTLIHRDNIFTKPELVEFISKFKVFYIEKGDTFNVSEKFYDGVSYWDTKSGREIDGIMFIHYYWMVNYTATLTDDMFVKK